MLHHLDRYRALIRSVWIALLVLLGVALAAHFIVLVADWRVVVVLLAAAVLLGVVVRVMRRWLPRRTILAIDFERGVVEFLPPDLLGRLAVRRSLVMRDVLDALLRATADRRVVGLLARVGPANLGLAHVQEIREAIHAFRRAGKKAVCWCETLGEGRATTTEYHLASAFDEIHLQPGSDVSLNGMMIQQPFIRGLLDKLGILPRIDHRRQYKSFKYLFTEHEMTSPHRESLGALLQSRLNQIVADVARDRKLDESAVRELIDRAPLLPDEVLAARLVDALSYGEEVEEKLKEQLDAKPIAIEQYLARAGRPNMRGNAVALIYGVGAVARSQSSGRQLPPGAVMAADEIVAAFREAVESKRIKAIVFRIDSPGGSVVASESIWHAVKRARDKGKPVIVSMSNIAGSGGYYISAPANRIVAMPGTITGSIGVVFGKMVTAGAWRKVGINWDSVEAGANAAVWSTIHDFSDDQWQKVQGMLDHIYEMFKHKVVEGRGLSPEQVESAAQGRVWTGEQALEHRLVDELGGLTRAIELAKQEAKIPTEQEVRLITFPHRRPLEMLLGRGAAAVLAEEAVQIVAPAAELARMLRPPHEGLLSVPPIIRQMSGELPG